MSRAAAEGGRDALADPRGIERAGNGQQNQVHQIFHARVWTALPRQGVGVQLFGELFFPRRRTLWLWADGRRPFGGANG